MLSSFRTRTKITLGIFTPLIFLVFMGLTNLFSVNNLLFNMNWVTHTHKALADAKSVLAATQDAAILKQTYLVSGNPAVFEMYNTHVAQTFSEIEKLKIFVSDNPEQVRRLEESEQLFREWLTDIAEPSLIKRGEMSDESTVAELRTLLKGRKNAIYFLNFRNKMREFEAVERELLAQRELRSDNKVSETHILIFACILLSLILGYLISWRMGNSIAKPIVNMTRAMRQLASGNLSTEVPKHETEGEIGEMADALVVFKEAMVKLSSAEEKATEANRAKTTFLATMSHEIRTPLNGVLGMSRLLESSDLNEQQKEKVNTIIESGELLLDLLNDILDISKIEENQLELEETHLDINEVLSKCHQLWAPRFEEKHIDFTIRNNLQPYTNLEGDPTRFYQVLQNLLGNALKFTHAGEVTITSSLLEETDTSVQVKIEVEDTGIGISEAGQKALFDRFSQVDSSIARKYGGSGLGLSICRELASLMGGEIGVESQEGVGTRFWFTANLTKLSESRTNPAQQQAEQTNPTHMQFDARTRILIAEDNKVNQKVIAAFLKVSGLSADIAENGLEATQMAAANEYDLILMDIQMPEMDGIAATKEIRNLSPYYEDIPVIAITANATSDSLERFLSSGMDDYIPKPIDPSQLVRIISKYVPLADKEISQNEVQASASPQEPAQTKASA